MAFGRKKTKASDDDVAPAPTTTDESATATEPGPTTGPYDLADAPDDDLPRVDLGSLRVPVPEGVELRVDVGEGGQVVAVTLVERGSQMQVNAFAAPRRSGIWDDVRTEIRDALRQQGGSGEEVDGPLGTELRARVPQGQPGMSAPARFVGVDGPRWFLRALISGPAATDAAQAESLLAIFRNVVVVRGGEAMAPRDPLLLHLPREAQEAVASRAHDDGGERPATDSDFNPFERGPEITESR